MKQTDSCFVRFDCYCVTTVICMVYVMHTTWKLWINAVCSNVPMPYTCLSYLTTNTSPCYLHIATSESGAKSCYKSALQVVASRANVGQNFSVSWCKHKSPGGSSDVQWWLENIKCCHNCALFNKAGSESQGECKTEGESDNMVKICNESSKNYMSRWNWRALFMWIVMPVLLMLQRTQGIWWQHDTGGQWR